MRIWPMFPARLSPVYITASATGTSTIPAIFEKQLAKTIFVGIGTLTIIKNQEVNGDDSKPAIGKENPSLRITGRFAV